MYIIGSTTTKQNSIGLKQQPTTEQQQQQQKKKKKWGIFYIFNSLFCDETKSFDMVVQRFPFLGI
jgi:hypothetical protein|tara:strand:- start:302 stop:496 length:195 start_codon:yes stop_codon:yes gene_type:complete